LDGEYFARVLLASEGTRFVSGTGIFYRMSPSNRISYIGDSDKKKESLTLAMRLHVEYIRSLEDSHRVRTACLTYLQNWYHHFYPERADLMAELQELAGRLGGRLEVPRLRWKYAWMRPVFGWKIARSAQDKIPSLRACLDRQWDKLNFELEERRTRQKRTYASGGKLRGDTDEAVALEM
jgi:hypothetical protein